MQRATLKLYDSKPADRRPQARARARHHRLPVQPQGSHHREVGEVGAQARAGREDGRPAAVQRRRAVQADPGDVLRRHRPRTTAASSTAVEKLFSCCVPTEKSAGTKKPAPPLVVLHWGTITQLPGLRHLGQRQVHAVLRRRHPDPRDLQRDAGGDAGRAGKQNPTSGGSPSAGCTAWSSGDSLASVALRRVRRPHAVATAGRVQRDRRPAAAPARQRAAAAHARGAGRADEPCHQLRSSSRSTARRCPPTSKPLLLSRYVDDSLRLPDLFVLRFRDSERIVLAKSGVKIGSKAKISVPATGSQTARAADRGRGHRARGGVRQHRHLHGHPRIRPGAPAVPRPAHRDLHADDGLRHRHPGRPARRPDGRQGRVDQHRVRPRLPGRASRLGVPGRLAREIGYEIAVRDGKFDFTKPRHGGRRRRPPAATRTRTRWCCGSAPTCCGSAR